MSHLSNLGLTSELAAVNTLLRAAGESPVETLDANVVVDVGLALDILRDTSREVQQRGWRFNTEHGYEIAKSATMVWADRVYGNRTISIFKVPSNLLTFTVTAAPWQQGASYLDTAIRQSRVYTEGDPAAPVAVFYDRVLNRDGFEGRDYIYIDPTWVLDFDHLPEPARQYIMRRAARRFAQQVVGSAELSGFSQQDEGIAWRDLKSTEGAVDDHNIFQNHSVTRILGNRPLGPSGFQDGRASPGRTLS